MLNAIVIRLSDVFLNDRDLFNALLLNSGCMQRLYNYSEILFFSSLQEYDVKLWSYSS